MEPKDASHAIRYFFEGDFLPYRKAFQMRCPPAMRLDNLMDHLMMVAAADIDSGTAQLL